MRRFVRFSTAALLLAAGALRLGALPREGGLAQHVRSAWTVQDGLPSDSILDGLQDAVGYVWLASYDGLARFDGEVFTVFGPGRGGFEGKSPRVLAAAPDGTLWIGTNTTGLFSYRGGAFSRYGLEEGLPDLSVRSLAIGRSGELWVGTARGVALLSGGRLSALRGGAADQCGIATFLLPLEGGGVVVGSNLPGLWIVEAGEFRPYLPGQGLEGLSFSAAFIDGANGLWLGSSTGQIFRISRNAIVERLALPELAGASVNCFHGDPDGGLWIGTDRGIAHRAPGAEGFDFLNEASGLPSDVVSSIWRDREGNLWVGTERGGLIKFSPGKFVNLSKRDGLPGDAVNGVARDLHGGLWVATDAGVARFPGEAPADPGWERAAGRLVASLAGVRVRQVRADPDGGLWFSTYSDRGLIVLGPDGKTRSYGKAEGLPTNRVRFSYRTRSGAVWIGTTAGPALLEGGAIRAYDASSGLPNLFILSAMEDSKGRIWLGTDGGGLALLEGGRFRCYTAADGLPGNVVFRLVEDAAGRLWVSTADGLCLYEGGSFRPANGAAGLAGDSVYETLVDAAGKLWMISGRKVVVAPADELAAAARSGSGAASSLRVFDRLDGLAGQLSANAWAYVSPEGLVYLPTLQGLSFYNPQSVPVNTTPPPVLVERVEIDGRPAPSGGGTVTVPAAARRLTFGYTALSFVVPQRVRFQYRLEGFDADWVPTGAGREISYTNLPPGDYRFRVRAENNDGVVNEAGASVEVRRLPYFYQTVPFYVALALALVEVGFLAAYIRVLRLRRRELELGRLVDERTDQLAAERDKSEALLRNVLPQSVAEELKASGRAAPCVYAEASVLFADLVDFTARAESLDPAVLIGELNEIFTIFDDILSARLCERIKTSGDGYLACCGVPVPMPDHASRLLGAALDMLEGLKARNASGGLAWELRIGVASGPVVGGVVGVRKYIFDVFGDTVNTAFRLQALSVPGGIALSEAAARLLGEPGRLVRRPARKVKGKGSLASYYLRYREGFAPLASSDEATALVESARDAVRAGRPGDRDAILSRIDASVVEPELLAAMRELGAKGAAG